MNQGLLIRCGICLIMISIFLYSYIRKQNEITELRLTIPSISRQIKSIEEESTAFQFKIDQFSNPQHLIELSRQPEYRHLKHPLEKEIIVIYN